MLPAKIYSFINLFSLVHFKLIESQFTCYLRCIRQHGSQSTTSKASDKIFISILAFLLPCIRANTQLYPEGNINFKKIPNFNEDNTSLVCCDVSSPLRVESNMSHERTVQDIIILYLWQMGRKNNLTVARHEILFIPVFLILCGHPVIFCVSNWCGSICLWRKALRTLYFGIFSVMMILDRP